MKPKHHGPLIMPKDYHDEIGMLTKPELMDIAWLMVAETIKYVVVDADDDDIFQLFRDYKAKAMSMRRKAKP